MESTEDVRVLCETVADLFAGRDNKAVLSVALSILVSAARQEGMPLARLLFLTEDHFKEQSRIAAALEGSSVH
jgi:hypothetical protein